MLGVRDLIYFDFVATFIALMLLGRLLQEKASAASRRHLSSRDAAPRELATPGGGSLPVGDLAPGTEFLLAPGSALPAAATLTGGDAEFSLEWISGEPEPRPWKRGRRVPSGAINIGRAPVALRAEEAYADSLVAKLTAGAKGRAFRHAGLERLLRWYLGAVLGIAVAGFAAWLASGAKFGDALQVFISVLVVSCPCAIGVAIPLADELAAGALRRIGLFVKSADIWAKLSGIRRIAFDKTGTLTLEVPELANPEALAALDPAARSALAALVRDSLHPAAQALREALEATGTGGSAPPMVGEVEETPGQGVAMAAGDGARWTLGRPGWQGEPAGDPDASSQLCRNGRAVAAFRFREALRTGAADEIAQLRAAGLDIVILSGDRRANVARMGAALGLPPDACLAELTPDQKAERVGEGTLFLGDGANDSLAFDAAACRGTPASDSGILGAKCDFFFLGRGLRAIRAAFQVAALRRRTVVNAFAFALIYNAAAVGAALAGWMSPLLAAILMPISSLVTLALVTASLRR
ncbi:MAG: HAD-IC family P-type ATPase [Verrucomicrobiales bacterium]